MKFGSVHSILLAAALMAAALVSATENSAATPQPQVTTSTVHVMNPAILKGLITNVQLDDGGNPEWIESGFLGPAPEVGSV